VSGRHTGRLPAVPRITFTDPEIASAGLTEAQASDQGLAVRTGITQVPSSARCWNHRSATTASSSSSKIPIAASWWARQLQGRSAERCSAPSSSPFHGQVRVARLRTMIYAFPTLHRAIEAAPADLAES
jgi:pyruvate/2-oxoglutarate dehydrogenase complex dihydrolipoamide dehydrogenase (E3) component